MYSSVGNKWITCQQGALYEVSVIQQCNTQVSVGEL